MTNQELFIQLLHRLRRYPEAMVLHALLRQQADDHEFKNTATRIALDLLGGQVEKKHVQRALDRLVELGVVQVRIHANYRTHISVDREAVNSLLATPVSTNLPGLQTDRFPFLEQHEEVAQAD